MKSGVGQISQHLEEALSRGVHVRLLTTDYLLVTDPAALGYLLDRMNDPTSKGSLTVKIFSGGSTSFHPKAYIFSSANAGGVALVGSSNLSRSGLRGGVEWNVRSENVDQILSEFELLWSDTRSIDLTNQWLQNYTERKALVPTLVGVDGQPVLRDPEGEEEQSKPPAPTSVQREALAALESTRIEGHQAGLVVMATGLGKTWLASFDSNRPQFRRTLFVAHRETILTQSRDVFRMIRPGASLSIYMGEKKDSDGDVVFASVQSLHRNLDEFGPEEFDYIVVDEFHHASASTYRKVLAHFRPKFLVGLTATPDRSDNADLLALCGDNLVYDCNLIRGISDGLLSPFKYRAIKDVADYTEIPWRGGRFDIDELSRRLETQQRAQQVFNEWVNIDRPNKRTLSFCCSITHADFMAQYFRDKGVAAVSLHSGDTSAARIDSIDDFKSGIIPIIFSVDLFSEGFDVPEIDLVMMLRPTESPIVFLQQLGRGLRTSNNKDHLDVIDLVGNHKGFLRKAQILASLGGRDVATNRGAISVIKDGLIDLPPGCEIIVELEVLEMFEQLLGSPKKIDELEQLVHEWIENHDGARPSALEVALLTRKHLELKSQGGWYGFLYKIGVLSDVELQTFQLANDLLADIEYGAYTKSYKLVTLKVLLSMGLLRGNAPINEVALGSRWEIFSDPRLVADVIDAKSSFRDVWNPSETEWNNYWRKNPIAALTGESSSRQTWFDIESDDLVISLAVPPSLGATFDSMVQEIVAYRLHRYLVQRKSSEIGVTRKPLTNDGQEINAAFRILSVNESGASIVFESAGGKRDSSGERNPEYVDGIDLVLRRLSDLNAVLLDAYVDSGRVQELPIVDRRLATGSDTFPIELNALGSIEKFRARLLNSQRKVGRASVSTSGGNTRKAMRISVGNLDGAWPIERLADHLAGIDVGTGNKSAVPASSA